jgi:hypothetical protein
MARKEKTPKTIFRTQADIDSRLLGTGYIDPIILENRLGTTSLPEIRFAMFWASVYPELDLWYQWPISAKYSRSCWDFAHLPTKIGIEIQGGMRSIGGHNTFDGVDKDIKKQTRAAELGWTYLAIISEHVEDGDRVSKIAQVIKSRMENANSL